MLCSDLVELSEFGQSKLLILFIRARILVHLGTIVETRRSTVDTIAVAGDYRARAKGIGRCGIQGEYSKFGNIATARALHERVSTE